MIGQFFILGNPRSGTSLLRLLLHAHSRVCVPPECGFLLWLYAKYKDWTLADLQSLRLDAFVADVVASKKFETWGVQKALLKQVILSVSPADYDALAQCVYLSYVESYKAAPMYLGDKNNYYIAHLDALDKVYADKYIIHLVRDGRDVACSYRGIGALHQGLQYLPQLSTEIDIIAKEWQLNNMRIYNHYHLNARYIMIRYEDLLLAPSVVLEALLSRLGLVFEAGMLDFYTMNREEGIEPKATLAWKQKTLQPIDPSSIGVYKTDLTAEEISEFNAIAGTALTHFGYAT